MSKNTHSQAGFTIVELLITIILLALAVPVLGSLVSMLSGVNDRARDLALIHALAENKIESLRSAGFGNLALGTTSFTSELPSSIATPRSAQYVVTSVSTPLKQVQITISYNDHGQTRTLNYRTYIGELGVGQY